MMKRTVQCRIAWVVPALLFTVAPVAAQQPSLEPLPLRASSTFLSHSLLSERSDLRLEFHANYASLGASKSNGVFMLVNDGILEHARFISTNECKTVGGALTNYAPQGYAAYRQIRVIRMDSVVQTPKPRVRDKGAREAIMAIELAAGDVVIVTRIEF